MFLSSLKLTVAEVQTLESQIFTSLRQGDVPNPVQLKLLVLAYVLMAEQLQLAVE